MTMHGPRPTVFNSQLICYVHAVRVVGNGIVQIEIEEDNCTDMNGAIALATALMPGCQKIVTYAGKKRDTCYLKRGNCWTAIEPSAQ